VGFFIATAAIHPLVRDSLGLYGSERSVKLEMESAAITSNILRPPSGRATPRWDSIRESRRRPCRNAARSVCESCGHRFYRFWVAETGQAA
jgi:hypothetical protein